MKLSHDELADLLSRRILEEYRNIFGDVFISNVSIDFPKPDFIYIPLAIRKIKLNELRSIISQQTLTGEPIPLPTSFEVKTPFVYKHEYLTGIGQAIAYNSIFPLSYLVIPDINMEGFEVKNYISNVCQVNKLNIGIFAYDMNDPNNVGLIKQAELTLSDPRQIKASVRGIKRSYSYWRETKPEEVFEALRISYELRNEEGNIMDKLLERLWSEVLKRRFPRTKRKSSFLLNYKLFLIQNSLIDSTGRLTIVGRHVLNLGERFGVQSDIFKEIITYVLLKYGGHYLLLSKIYKLQLEMSEDELSSWDNWINGVVKRLSEQNYYISKDDFRIDLPRVPYAYKNYFHGIVEKGFVKGRGILINYPRIMEILEKGRQLFAPIEVTLSP